MNTIYSSMLIVILAATVAGPAVADSQWLCVADQQAGFKWTEEKGWNAVTVKPDIKYVITKRTDDYQGVNFKAADYLYHVRRIGEEEPIAGCTKVIFELHWKFVECDTSLRGQFLFRFGLGRYLRYSANGYWDGTDEESSHPYMEIGKCSPL